MCLWTKLKSLAHYYIWRYIIRQLTEEAIAMYQLTNMEEDEEQVNKTTLERVLLAKWEVCY